ncbi:MAG: YifB family Mg chelatase-like AAA ATPase [Microgenomates group bacterium]
MNVTYTAALSGLESQLVHVEVRKTRGTPQLILIGLAGKTIVESRERIRSALTSCNIRIPASRIVINLAPADIPKVGSHYELAICAALLIALRKSKVKLDTTLFLGELSLDGSIRPIRGALAMVTGLIDSRITTVIVPKGNFAELSLLTSVSIHPIEHVSELIDFMYESAPLPNQTQKLSQNDIHNRVDTLGEIHGQENAKRALEIAAAGGHNVLMTGPPGSGKSMLAKALPEILPPLTIEESVQVTAIHSLCGLTQDGFLRERPFRSPHHATSRNGLLGGHVPIRPGELSLAHRGVLFLDELPEFSRDCLESLRQPLEDGQISIVRAQETVVFPAQCSLIAAANPCPCGYFGTSNKICNCTPTQIQQYKKKLSGPLLDRFDLHIYLQPVKVAQLLEKKHSFSAQNIQKRVLIARKIQHHRYASSVITNATASSSALQLYCALDKKSQSFLAAAVEKLHLSARNYYRVLRVSRTIADLHESTSITQAHVAESLQFRQQYS